MKTIEFVALAQTHAERTSHLRVYSQTWEGGVWQLPEAICCSIGSILALMQGQIDKGQLCKKDECVLLYNFQPLYSPKGAYFCTLEMLIKPLSTIAETNVLLGKPFQLIVNGTTAEVMNASKALIEMGFSSEEELREEGSDLPQSFGKYTDYPPLFSQQTPAQSTRETKKQKENLQLKLLTLMAKFAELQYSLLEEKKATCVEDSIAIRPNVYTAYALVLENKSVLQSCAQKCLEGKSTNNAENGKQNKTADKEPHLFYSQVPFSCSW